MRNLLLALIIVLLGASVGLGREPRHSPWLSQSCYCIQFSLPPYIRKDILPRTCFEGCGPQYAGRKLRIELYPASSVPKASDVNGFKERQVSVSGKAVRVVEFYLPKRSLAAPTRVLQVELGDACDIQSTRQFVSIGSDPTSVVMLFRCDDKRAYDDAWRVIASIERIDAKQPVERTTRPN